MFNTDIETEEMADAKPVMAIGAIPEDEITVIIEEEIKTNVSATEPVISSIKTTETPTEALTSIIKTLITEAPTIEQTAEAKVIKPQLLSEPIFTDNEFSVIHENFIPSENLINKINDVIKNDKYRTSFYLKSLDGTIEMGYNPAGEYYGDSTIKTTVALYIYNEVLEGRADLETPIGEETIGSLLDIMLHISDSGVYHILRDYFGKDKINKATEDLGCKTFKIYNQWAYATPIDAAILWEEVYRFINRSGEIGKLFMNQLINAQWNFVNDALGKYTVAHKYGNTDDVFAENCFVLKDKGRSYIFAYYSSSGYDYENNILSQVINILDEIMIEYDNYSNAT